MRPNLGACPLCLRRTLARSADDIRVWRCTACGAKVTWETGNNPNGYIFASLPAANTEGLK